MSKDGPRITDEEFFFALDIDEPGLNDVKVARRRISAAGRRRNVCGLAALGRERHEETLLPAILYVLRGHLTRVSLS